MAMAYGLLQKQVVIGMGMVVIGVVLLPAWRPITRGIIKGGILAFEKSREWVARLAESLEDIIEEVRAELAGDCREAGLSRKVFLLEDSRKVID